MFIRYLDLQASQEAEINIAGVFTVFMSILIAIIMNLCSWLWLYKWLILLCCYQMDLVCSHCRLVSSLEGGVCFIALVIPTFLNPLMRMSLSWESLSYRRVRHFAPASFMAGMPVLMFIAVASTPVWSCFWTLSVYHCWNLACRNYLAALFVLTSRICRRSVVPVGAITRMIPCFSISCNTVGVVWPLKLSITTKAFCDVPLIASLVR